VNEELRLAATRVLGFVRARQLMSNTDPEVIGDIAITINTHEGPGKPMEFRLLSSDLDALTAAVLGVTVDLVTGKPERRDHL